MPTKIAIGLPTYPGYVVPGHGLMWLTMGGALKQYSDRFTLVGYVSIDVCGVAMARNLILAHAMEVGADWVLMIDSDTWADNGYELLRMISQGIDADATIVGAPIFKKDGKLAVYRLEHDKPVSIDAETFVNVDRLVKVDAIGGACMAINLHKIGDAMFSFTDEDSEDLNFCKQIREQSGKIFIDPRVKTSHLGKAQSIIYQPKVKP